MHYLDVYFSRLNHLGETTAERIQNGGTKSFEKWMAESPHTVKNLSVERGLYFPGIIIRSKDKEYEKIMLLHVENDIPIVVGDIVNWQIEDASIEKWLIIQKEKKVNGTYQTFWIVRCNYLMKWIDTKGHLQQSWSYFVSSLDSKIKGNFRTWNSLITPQPNKYAELLMPRYPIERSTNFIVEEESWSVVEYDHTSVPGVIYLSLTENKINLIYDDVENDIADTDKLAQYSLSIPDKIQVFKVGEIIQPKFTLTKNGYPIDEPVNFLPIDKKITRLIDGNLTAVGAGRAEIIVQLSNYPTITQNLLIEVGEQEQEFSAYIKGDASIRLDRVCSYVLKGTSEIEGKVNFYLEETKLAMIDPTTLTNDGCQIQANAKDNLGTIILHAEYNGKDYIKEISIIPLW